MTRTIPAKDVVVGQTIRWKEDGTTFEVTVGAAPVYKWSTCIAIRNDEGYLVDANPDTEVTVLEEATIQQPDDPRRVLARVEVDGHQFACVQYHCDEDSLWCLVEATFLDMDNSFTWGELREMGHITILD